MTKPPRMRMVAGPNGSGKSSLIKILRRRVPLGVYVNADDIESVLARHGAIDLAEYSLRSTQAQFKPFVRSSGWSKLVGVEDVLVRKNFIVKKAKETTSYHAALVADFIRERLLRAKISFTFETVMSHPSKVELLQDAQSRGFRTYLYFVGTESPEINVRRVASRVKKGGHPVASDKVISRYFKSLELLFRAIENSNRAYIFDNSHSETELKLEATNATVVKTFGREMPLWIDRYVLKLMSAM